MIVRTLTAVFVLSAFLIPADASIIAEVSGPFSSNASVASPDPFGGYDYAAASWTQTSTYSGVNIMFLGQSVLSSASGVAYLTKSFGPGTTTSDQIATAAFTVPFEPNAASVTVFSGLTLAPGTYFLTLAANSGAEIEWNVTDTPTITSAAGVIVNQGQGCFNGSSPAAYPPGTTGTCVPESLLYTVSNGPAVPEPGTFSLGIAGIFAGYLLRLTARRKQISA